MYYRIWDKINKRFAQEENEMLLTQDGMLYRLADNMTFPIEPNYIVSLASKVKDKNNNFIYNRDIIKVNNDTFIVVLDYLDRWVAINTKEYHLLKELNGDIEIISNEFESIK